MREEIINCDGNYGIDERHKGPHSSTHDGFDGGDTHHVGVIQEFLIRVGWGWGDRLITTLLAGHFLPLTTLLWLGGLSPSATGRCIGGSRASWDKGDPGIYGKNRAT